jgi:hypothetical protein
MLEGVVETLSGLGGWAVGLGAAVLLGPKLVRGMRPMAKTVIKGYLAVSDRIQVTAAETRENLEDLVAEARAEASAERPTSA